MCSIMHIAFIKSVDSYCIGIRYVTVSIYDTNITSLIINYSDTSAFYQHVMHDSTYDTPHCD